MPPAHRILTPLPVALRGDRVTLRPWRAGDGEALFAIADAERERLQRWMPWPEQHRAPADSEAFVRERAARWALREDLAVALVADGGIAGGSGMHRFDWAIRAFEIGYWIRAGLEGRGIVREAAQLLTALAFETLDATRVFIRCEPANVRSAAVPRSLAFVHEGVGRRTLRRADGSLGDAEVWSLVPEEWATLPWRGAATARVLAAEYDPPREPAAPRRAETAG
jgi:RimJ/RimL family protein N-acetyltransferase